MIESLCHFILWEELSIFSFFRDCFPIDHDIGVIVPTIFVLHKSRRYFRRLRDILPACQCFHLLTAISAIIQIVFFAKTHKVTRSRQFLNWRIDTTSIGSFPLKLLIGPDMPGFIFNIFNAISFFLIIVIFSKLRFHNEARAESIGCRQSILDSGSRLIILLSDDCWHHSVSRRNVYIVTKIGLI